MGRKAGCDRPLKKLMRGFVAVFLVLMAVLALPPVRKTVERQFYPQKYQDEVELWADEYDLDPLLVDAFIRGKMTDTENLTFDDLYDPAVSIRFGCYYLHLCLVRYNGDVATAAAAYHSGWGTVDALLRQEEHSADGVTLKGFPYSQMHHYVEKIQACYGVYTSLYAGE